MAHLGGSGTSCSAFYGGPYGKGKTPFYKIFVEIHGGMEFLRVGLVRFIFGP